MLRELLELYYYHSKWTERFAMHDVKNVFEKTMRDLATFGFAEIRGKKILDLGCGQRYAFALQCAAAGAEVTALDINYIKPDFLPLAFVRTIQHNGIKRALKTFFRRVLFDKRYYDILGSITRNDLGTFLPRINFIISDPISGHYPLPADSFDLIFSNAVVEHLVDVLAFSTEVKRLLKKGGYFYAIIHNFYSISGGHNLEWAYPDDYQSQNVPPWDHLRENRFPPHVYLNRWKPKEYENAFSENLEVINFEGVGLDQDPKQLEGERLLTSEVSREMNDYNRELLLTRAWRLICVKDALKK